MDRKFERPSEVVPSKICQVRLIINIIYLDLVELAPFEVILHVKALDPARAQVVVDDLRHTDALPLSACLAVENKHAVSPGERIQIWQILTREAETYGLDQAASGGVDRLIDSGEDGLIEIAANARP